MVYGPSFYIYGGGRWREVDISDGRVEGWGRTRFVYTKRGKVHMAKTRAVLAALRDLKANGKSAIRDGARLPHTRTEPLQKNAGRNPATSQYDWSQCTRQLNYNGDPPSKPITQSELKLKIGTQSATKIDAAIQTSLPSQTLTLPATLKQKSDESHSESTSSDENVPTQITTTAMVNSSPNKLAKLKLKKQWALAGNVSPKKKVPSLKLHKEDSTKYNLYKRKRSESSDSLVWVVLPKNQENEKSKQMYNGNENAITKSNQMKRRRASTSSKSGQESRPRKIVKRTKSGVDIEKSNTKKIQSEPNYAIKNINENPRMQKSGTKHNKNSDDVVLSKSQLNTESISNKKKIKPTRQDNCKELIIDNSDVELLRNYLMHTGSDFDLLKFDQDDEYKKEFFYTINPLVKIERCQKIARMLRRGSQSEISLKDFASQLGLTSVSDKILPKRYKLRNRTSTDQSDYETDTKDSKTEKNTVKKGSGNHATHKKYLTATKTDEVKKSSSNERIKNQDAYTSNRHGQRHSTGNRKETNRRNDVVEIFSPKKRSAKSDGDYSDEDSSVEEVKARVLRGKRKSDSTGNLDLILTSDSEVHLKKLNKRDQNIRRNRNTNKIKNNTDLTKSNDEDSDWVFEKETKRRSIRLSKRRNTDQDTNDESSEVESLKEAIKRERNKNNKRDETKQTDNQTVTDEENVAETSRTSKTLLKRNRKGQFLKRAPTIKKKDTKDSSDENSEADDKPLKSYITRKQKNKTNNSSTNNKNTENSEEKFESKEAKDKRQDKLNNTKNNMSKPKENSADEFESQKEVKSRQRNKLNAIKNDNNDRNNNMTDSNDEKSEAEERKAENSTNQNIRKQNPKKSERWISSLYSNLEDQAIVAWVSVGGRAQCVNGNRIWKELQDQYSRIAGQHRTWHSLRNRYLRGILPNLGQLALNPSVVARLRAAAATGEIKSRNFPTRRNSIFGAPVKGALSRRPRAVRSPSTEEELPPKRHKHDHTRKQSVSNPKVLRSSFTTLPENARPDPSYSDITRHFAATHHESSPNSLRASPERGNSRNTSLETKKSEKKSDKSTLDTKKSDKSQLETKTTDKNSSMTKKSDKSTLETKKSDKSQLETKKTEKTTLETKKSDKILLETKSSAKNTPDSFSGPKINLESAVKSSASKLSSARKTSSTTMESATEERRRSLRNRTPARESEKSPERGRTKIRRLFNPSSMI